MPPPTTPAEPSARRTPPDAPATSAAEALAGAPFGVVVLDRALRFVHVNAWMAEVDGLPPEAHAGRTLRELFPDLADQIAAVEARLRGVLETGEPATFSIVCSRPDRSRLELVASSFPVRGASGAIEGACGLVTDVTKDREREEALARVGAAAERTARRLERLVEVTAALSAASDPVAVAEVVVARSRRLVDAASVVLRVWRGGTLEPLAASPALAGDDAPRAPDLPVGAAGASGAPVWLPDRAAIEAAFPGAVAACGGCEAIAALPLAAGGGRVGTLCFAFATPQAFGDDDRALLAGIAEQCAQALDRALTHAAERASRLAADQARLRLARLQVITAALSAASTVEEVAGVLVHAARTALGAHTAVAYVVAPGGEALSLVGSMGKAAPHRRRLDRLPIDAPTPAAQAARTGESCWLETREAIAAAFPRFGEVFPQAQEVGAVAALPLRSRGEVLGSLGFAFEEERTLAPDARELLGAVADQAAQALDRARLLDDERRAREEAERAREAAERAREEAEAARAQAERAQEEAVRARSLLDGLVENAPLGIAFFDRELRYLRVNPSLAAMNGIAAEAHVGRTPRELLPGLPVEEVERAFHRVLESGEPVVDLEVAGESPAGPGRRVWVESWYPVRAGGEIVGVGALAREITLERDAQEFQRHVVGVVGHDLRSPLSAIVNATALLSRTELAPAQARVLARVASSAGRIEEIVRSLLDYANVRGGRGVPVRRRRCDLAELAHAVGDECALAHPGRTIECAGEGRAEGEWDPDRIAQVLANLVTNALQHGPAAAPVAIRWRGAEEEVVLEVQNEGAPIAPGIAASLFEPFRRGEGGGLGLGLFIAREIVKAHGGRIEVRSSAEEGTTFSVYLPRR